MYTYQRLMQYIRPYRLRLTAAVICMILAAAGNLVVPWIIKDVIDEVLINKDMMMLNLISVGILVVFILRGFFSYGQTYLITYIGQRIIIDLRQAVYKHLQRLSQSYFDQRQTGAVMSVVTNDVGALQTAVVNSLVEFITEAVVLTGSLISMIILNWKLTLVTFVTMPLVMQAIRIFGRKLRGAGGILQERTADITSSLQESISGMRVIRSFAREEYEIQRFSEQNYRNFRAQMKATQLMATLTPIIELLAAVGVVLIIWYGGRAVIDGAMTSGALIAFLIYLVNLSNPVKRLSRTYGDLQKAMAAADRVFCVLDTKPEIVDKPDAVSLPAVTGQVELEQVSFSYTPEVPALREVSLQAKPGDMVAIVGPSGAGKSTIANLLPRFYDVTAGSIRIDGYDVREVTQHSLRTQIGIVPQETLLFNGTVEENILYGRLDATEEEILAAARAANAHAFIEQMPLGYQTMIGERGAKISGGQRQRIAIARAILKDPRILILDEATSALDTESEKLVQEALDKLMVGRTSFVIAHRLSTIQRANQILVMDAGRIVERGTHQELLAQNGLYHQLYQLQFRKGTGGQSE